MKHALLAILLLGGAVLAKADPIPLERFEFPASSVPTSSFTETDQFQQYGPIPFSFSAVLNEPEAGIPFSSDFRWDTGGQVVEGDVWGGRLGQEDDCPVSVPEPSSIILLSAGLLFLFSNRNICSRLTNEIRR